MSVAWLWLVPVILVPLLAMAIWRRKRPAKREVRYVGSAETLAALPSYAREKRRADMLKRLEMAMLCLLLITLTLIAARPQQQIRKVEDTQSRDIVLCADVSGSMYQYLPVQFETLQEIVNQNPTDRYALVLFAGAPYVALPLTNDVTAINMVTSELVKGYTDDDFATADFIGYDPAAATGGTDIGSGLAACIRRFDKLDEPRSRHIILTSDMSHNGAVDPDLVATLIPKYGIKLYILTIDSLGVQDAQDIARIAGATVSDKLTEADAKAELTAIYQSVLNTRTSAQYVMAEAPYPLWGAALIATAGWAAAVVLRWRRP